MASGGDPEDPRRVVFNHSIKQRELRHGDHIYAHRKGYTYSHHGIWDGKKREVVHFTQATGRTSSARARQASRLASGRSADRDKPAVVATSLDDFLESEDGKGLKLHTYDDGLHGFKLNGTCSAIRANPNSSRAVEVARWFAKQPTSFGEYSFTCWNCESFATFCKTTTLTAEQLSREYDRIGHDREAWRAFLAKSGCTDSEQNPSLNPFTGPFRALGKIILGMFGKAMEKLTDDVPN